MQPGYEKRILFRGRINAYTGYGLHSCQIIRDLAALGYDITVVPTERDEEFAPLPADIEKRMKAGSHRHEWELLLHPPNIAPAKGRKTIFFTMWEASRLPEEWVGFLNRAECVIVPCQWNATCFSASGLDRPIRVVPLGIKEDVFKPVPMRADGLCIFGAGGKVAGGGERKSLNQAIEVFQKAFPSESNVRLYIKAFPDCGVASVKDPRVQITADCLDERDLARWYADLTCFLSLSRSEGWGLMPHQTMAVGRPCIGISFGGQAEFLNKHVGYPVEYKLVLAEFNYRGGGVWAEPNEDHVISLMRRVYEDRAECRMLGRAAAAAMRPMTWQRSNAALLDVLREFNAVS